MAAVFNLCCLRYINTRIPPAGDGTPSKKLSLQEGSALECMLNLASLNVTQTT